MPVGPDYGLILQGKLPGYDLMSGIKEGADLASLVKQNRARDLANAQAQDALENQRSMRKSVADLLKTNPNADTGQMMSAIAQYDPEGAAKIGQVYNNYLVTKQYKEQMGNAATTKANVQVTKLQPTIDRMNSITDLNENKLAQNQSSQLLSQYRAQIQAGDRDGANRTLAAYQQDNNVHPLVKQIASQLPNATPEEIEGLAKGTMAFKDQDKSELNWDKFAQASKQFGAKNAVSWYNANTGRMRVDVPLTEDAKKMAATAFEKGDPKVLDLLKKYPVAFGNVINLASSEMKQNNEDYVSNATSTKALQKARNDITKQYEPLKASMYTADQHADLIRELAKNVDMTGNMTVNNLLTTYKKQTVNGPYYKLGTAIALYNEEINKIIAGSGGKVTDALREERNKWLNTKLSPETMNDITEVHKIFAEAKLYGLEKTQDDIDARLKNRPISNLIYNKLNQTQQSSNTQAPQPQTNAETQNAFAKFKAIYESKH